jgi:hypothetical protein
MWKSLVRCVPIPNEAVRHERHPFCQLSAHPETKSSVSLTVDTNLLALPPYSQRLIDIQSITKDNPPDFAHLILLAPLLGNLIPGLPRLLSEIDRIPAIVSKGVPSRSSVRVGEEFSEEDVHGVSVR